MDSILADAAGRTSIPSGDHVPVKADEVVWTDGSLGCPKPGKSYTQALVNGYWVIVVAGDRPLDDRVSGTRFLLPLPLPLLRRQPDRLTPTGKAFFGQVARSATWPLRPTDLSARATS